MSDTNQLVNGVVIPKTADVGGDGPMIMTGDEAEALIRKLYLVSARYGYKKVRLDRAQHPDRGDWFELGYVHGEVSVRWSHKRGNTALRRNDPTTVDEFLTFMLDNADFAELAGGQK